jgi:predicted RNA binding protein YcfA (HicA-like mRNA interferase family)
MIRHKQLEQESRTQVAIFRINPSEDIPVETLYNILSSAIKIYK